MNFAEPLDVFFGAAAEFSTAATYNGVSTVTGIFDNAGGGALGVAGARPKFTCKAADIPTPVRGQTLVIGSTTYKLQGWTLDSTGGVIVLDLERQ